MTAKTLKKRTRPGKGARGDPEAVPTLQKSQRRALPLVEAEGPRGDAAQTTEVNSLFPEGGTGPHGKKSSKSKKRRKTVKNTDLDEASTSDGDASDEREERRENKVEPVRGKAKLDEKAPGTRKENALENVQINGVEKNRKKKETHKEDALDEGREEGGAARPTEGDEIRPGGGSAGEAEKVDSPGGERSNSVDAGAKVKKSRKRKGLRAADDRLRNVWDEEKITARISEISAILEDPSQELPPSRKARFRQRLATLRKALAGECVVGGNQIPKAKNTKPDGSRITLAERLSKLKRKQAAPTTVARWKECYCCRKRGHAAAQCRKNPAAASGAGGANNLCFNCGSVEHTLSKCPIDRSDTLPFAQCFVCKGKGHLASACPENLSGVYPHGGGCHICNSPYHLMKDCPQKLGRNAARSAGKAANSAESAKSTESAKPAAASGKEDARKRELGKAASAKKAAATKSSKPAVLAEDNDEYWDNRL